MARLPKGAESTISMTFVVMYAVKIWRLFRLFFVTILAWLCISQSPRPLWRGLTNLWQPETADSLVIV